MKLSEQMTADIAALAGEFSPWSFTEHNDMSAEIVRHELDRDLADRIYETIASFGPDDAMRYLVIPGAPPSKARPRFAKGGRVYTPAESRAAEQRTAGFLALATRSHGPMTGNVAIGCVFFRPNRQRIDCDNLMKHICDAANGVLWHDDSQVTTVFGRVEFDAVHPRTLVVVAHDESTMMRGTDAWYPCPVCAKQIPFAGQTNLRKTCSRACATRARGYTPLDDLVACLQCEQSFRRTTTEQRFCSRSCSSDWRRDRRKNKATVNRCDSCGKRLAHSRGGRCRTCWRADPSFTATYVQPSLGDGSP